MSKNKKFFWLKLKEDFFENDDIKMLESMPNGMAYSNFYLKLLCKSIKSNGVLRYKNILPYTPEMLSAATCVNIDIVKSALEKFIALKMVEILDDGALYLMDIENMMGSETDSAERVRRYRDNIKCEKSLEIEEIQKQPLTDAERQRKHRAKKNCETKQHVPLVEDFQNNKRYGGNYYLVMQRDKYKCAECGNIENLCVHHIDGYDENKPQNNNVNKMIVLCRSCHSKIHNNTDIDEDILNSIDYYNDSVTNLCNANVTTCNANVQKCNTEIELYIEKEKEKELELKKSNERKTKTSVFAIPTIDEIKEYCKEIKSNIDADNFFDYYTSNGWMVGKQKMKDWKATVRRWSKNNFSNNNNKTELKTHNHNEFANFEEYDFCAEYEEMMKEVEGKNV